ncbi:sigma-70 family RNA polymerase sigma factor [Gangjinia marincola]|uniref:Sigma-70 family RNA polymerase sigma factor n=1 Tax=Gangjinia marincola TaxID=578463 RepID=A0ABN1MFL4_9FLAO
MTCTEEELIKRLKDASTFDEAFMQVVNQYKERLYWHIRHIVKIHEDADDVLQNVFVKVYKNVHSFKGESKLYSWMYRIATNESITFIHKRSKKMALSVEDYQYQLAGELHQDDYFSGDEIQLVLQQAIAQLPQRQQQVFNMRYFQEMKYYEIAEITELSVGALKSSYHHAVKKIEEFVKQRAA